MRKFFAQNINRNGRIVRLIWGVTLIIAGLLLAARHPWFCAALLVAGAFAVYEAARGWCLMRACGIKTKL